MILESMKMEIPITTPITGTVTEIRVKEGEVVQEGQTVAVVAGGALFALFFVYFGYFLVCEVVMGGRTPGKAAMGLRVVRLDGSAPDFVALLIRNVVRVLDVALFAAGIGVVIMFFHPLS